MCDYSLHAVASRPAKVGDKLITTKYSNTPTRGFSPIGEPRVAVCLLPGTEVAFEGQVEREPTGFLLNLFKRHSATIIHKVARFRQINLNSPSTHHDALEFPDGQIVLLTNLRVGQCATCCNYRYSRRRGSKLKQLAKSSLLAPRIEFAQRATIGRIPPMVAGGLCPRFVSGSVPHRS
jgi:hypothetical protein